VTTSAFQYEFQALVISMQLEPVLILHEIFTMSRNCAMD